MLVINIILQDLHKFSPIIKVCSNKQSLQHHPTGLNIPKDSLIMFYGHVHGTKHQQKFKRADK